MIHHGKQGYKMMMVIVVVVSTLVPIAHQKIVRLRWGRKHREVVVSAMQERCRRP